MILLDWPLPLTYTIIGIYGLLVFASITLYIAQIIFKKTEWSEWNTRTKTWWWIIFLSSLFFILGQWAFTFFFAAIAILGLQEYFTLLPDKLKPRYPVLFYLAIIVQYFWAVGICQTLFFLFIPVLLCLGISGALIIHDSPQQFLSKSSAWLWGNLLIGFNLSFIIALFPLMATDPASPYAWVAYLVILTESNDIFQYIFGKTCGKHAILPHISARKTLEGTAAGLLLTTLSAALLGHYLLHTTLLAGSALGLLISASGCFGDATFSALKRDLQTKDAGNLLPGHGGLLDRLDSLIFSAPLFYVALYFYFT